MATGMDKDVRVKFDYSSDPDDATELNATRMAVYVGELYVRDQLGFVVDSLSTAILELATAIQDLIASDERILWPLCEVHHSYFRAEMSEHDAIWQCHADASHTSAVGRLLV